PIILSLRMNTRIAIHLRGRCLQNPGLHALGKAEHIDRAVHARLDRLHRIVLVVHRRGWAGEIVDFIHLYIERKSDVVADQLEVSNPSKERGKGTVGGKKLKFFVSENVLYFPRRAEKEFVETDARRLWGDQPRKERGPEEASPAGDENTLFQMHSKILCCSRP